MVILCIGHINKRNVNLTGTQNQYIETIYLLIISIGEKVDRHKIFYAMLTKTPFALCAFGIKIRKLQLQFLVGCKPPTSSHHGRKKRCHEH